MGIGPFSRFGGRECQFLHESAWLDSRGGAQPMEGGFGGDGRGEDACIRADRHSVGSKAR
jgi:hypothetical protein